MPKVLPQVHVDNRKTLNYPAASRLELTTSSDTGNCRESRLFQTLLHVAGLQGVDHFVELTLHKKIQIIES